MQNISLVEAANMGRKSLPLKVRKTLVSNLIKQGYLEGKTGRDGFVVDDTNFRKWTSYGIDSFVHDLNSWSFVAVRAPVEEVAAALKAREDVSDYVEDVEVLALDQATEFQPEDRRHVFLLKPRACDWLVVLLTVDWIDTPDISIALLLTANLSSVLETKAMACMWHDTAPAYLVTCEKGKQVTSMNDEGDGEFYRFFYEEGIFVPKSYISTGRGVATLHVDPPPDVERADSAVFTISPKLYALVKEAFPPGGWPLLS